MYCTGVLTTDIINHLPFGFLMTEKQRCMTCRLPEIVYPFDLKGGMSMRKHDRQIERQFPEHMNTLYCN